MTHDAQDPVIAVNLLQSTAYAVRGERVILVDTGPAGQESRLLKKLARSGVKAQDVSLIVLTHCHPDHAGGAAELRQRLGVPIAVHRDEVEWATTGHSIFYQALRPFGHLLQRALPVTFPAFMPDIVLEHGVELDDYGAPLSVLHTPGHTPGSITLLHRPSGDAMVGDLLAGSLLRRNTPLLPFLAQDTRQLGESVRAVLSKSPTRLLFGHGRPTAALSMPRRYDSLTRIS